MASTAEPLRGGAEDRLRLIHEIGQRLEAAERLTGEMRAALARADAPRIEAATARLETVLLEYRLLAREYRHAGGAADGADDPRLTAAVAGLERTATRIARSSAVAGGVLERLVRMTRGLMGALGSGDGAAYGPSGRGAEADPGALRLREQA